MPVPDDGIINKLKHAAHFGQKYRLKKTVMIDGLYVNLQFYLLSLHERGGLSSYMYVCMQKKFIPHIYPDT